MSNFYYNYVPPEQLSDEPQAAKLTPGKAKFVIKTFYDRDKEGSPAKTQMGLPKVTLALTVTDSNRATGMVFDIFTANTAWKIKQLAEAIGIPGLYAPSGSLNLTSLTGKEGECMIKLDKRPGYDEKMVIEKYLPHDGPMLAQTRQDEAEAFDDLPF